MNKRTMWITQTGIYLAILIAAQVVTRPLGTTFITGSVVNMMLILALMLFGASSAITIGIVSPMIATIIGIGPLWPFVPVIIAGNIALILIWHIIAFKRKEPGKLRQVIALAAGAFAKFLILYIGIVNLIVPLIMGFPEPQASVVSFAFSWPQIITASIGGLIAMLIYPQLAKALPKSLTR